MQSLTTPGYQPLPSRARMTIPSSYATLTGIIRVLERHLIGPNEVTRMVEAPDPDTAFHVFNDLDYAGELLDLQATEYTQALDNKLARLRQVYERALPDKNLLLYIFQSKDFHNFKVLFKEKLFGETHAAPLSHLGNLDQEELRRAVREEKTDKLAEPYRTIIAEAHTAFTKKTTPEQIDTYFEKRYFSCQRRVTKKIGNPFLSNLVEVRTGIANIKIFLRARRLGKDLTYLQEHLIPGGRMREETLFLCYKEEKLDRFIQEVASWFDRAIGEAVARYQEDGNLWKLERDLENAEIAFVRKGKYTTYGPEVPVSYYYAKRNAIRNIRLIMTGKYEGLASQEIRERLRDYY